MKCAPILCSIIEHAVSILYSSCMNESLDDETHYKLLTLLEENPNITQRRLAEEMGVSVGKVNYCVKALIDVGHIKFNNFARSKNKFGYAYFLTPKGIKEKAKVTVRFLEVKKKQYECIKKEIAVLQKEISAVDK